MNGGRAKNGQFVKKKVQVHREKVHLNLKKKNDQEKIVLNESDVQLNIPCDGRRIVELETLARELWCTNCNKPLSLRNMNSEKRFGLASSFKVQCLECSHFFIVSSNKQMVNKEYAVNLKLAIGMIDAGAGETQINTILSELNIPAVSQSTLKKYERTVGTKMEELAKESCEVAVKQEIELTAIYKKNDSLAEVENPQVDTNERMSCETNVDESKVIREHLSASIDAGWQKRGAGPSYNSISGHSSLIGKESGKILGFGTRSKRCIKCSLGQKKDDHDCRKNFEGSSKAMEPDLAVQLVNNNSILKKNNARIAKVIGDGDASYMASIRRTCEEPIDKYLDFNHVKKSINGVLRPICTQKVFDYFSKSFSIAVKTNVGNADEVTKAIRNIVPHAYGEHENCGDWCEKNKDGEHVYSHLPLEKPLTDLELRVKVTQLFNKYADISEKLAPCASSQANESFNNMVSTKHPKNRYYAGSESFDFRVSCAVNQKNLGCSYVVDLHKKIGLSPGKRTLRFRNCKDLKRNKRAEIAKTTLFKRRRLFLKKQRSRKVAAAEKKEGVTYETECDLNNVSELVIEGLQDNTILENENFIDAVPVIFDLETTGFKNPEITQIAAIFNKNSFSEYIIPSRGIPSKVSEVTGLTIVNGEMFSNGQMVKSVSINTALRNFLNFLQEQGTTVILIAHNCFKFDANVLLHHLVQTNILDEFKTVVKGFADSLIITQKLIPDRKKEKKKFSQGALTIDFLGAQYLEGAHNALVDVQVLQQLINTIGINNDQIRQNTRTVSFILKSKDLQNMVNLRKLSFSCFKNSISQSMITKIAKAGIDKDLLCNVFKKGGSDGVRMLLSENVGKRPRVTNHKKTIESIIKAVSFVFK